MRPNAVTIAALVAIAGPGRAERLCDGRHSMERATSSTAQRVGDGVGAAAATSTASYHMQRQDHFDPLNERLWPQAYYVNDTFWRGPISGAPIFLCVGGEGPPLTPAVAVDSPHCNLAVEMLSSVGGLFLALEHRHYGCHNRSACPYSADDPHPLRHLSSRQAVNDIATFHSHASKRFSLASSSPWIAFGGSYPGMLASFVRIKFPHLIRAAVASSAPVRAILDFTGYNDVVADAYAVGSVGGSTECRAAIGAGHARVGELLDDPIGRERLAALFNLLSAEWLEAPSHRREFAADGVARFPAQSNDPAARGDAANIRSICRFFEGWDHTAEDALQRLARLADVQGARRARRGCLGGGGSGGGGVSAVAVTAEEPNYWGWQTCTEFGFYQTCERGSRCFFTQGLSNLSNQAAFCQREFGISLAEIADAVERTNLYYGADDPGGSDILYVNGQVDPWHAASVLSSPDPARGLSALWVPGASHHAWTHPSRKGDQPEVDVARRKIRNQVRRWLDESVLTRHEYM